LIASRNCISVADVGRGAIPSFGEAVIKKNTIDDLSIDISETELQKYQDYDSNLQEDVAADTFEILRGDSIKSENSINTYYPFDSSKVVGDILLLD
jgi:predicted phage-related endonuclease